MISVDRALEIVLENAPGLAPEEVPLAEALHRVLAEDVATDLDFPPFDRSAMDGFALRSADAGFAPVALSVVGEVRAGQWPSRAVETGQAVSIMTGAPLPPGADSVQQVEKTRRLNEGWVEVLAAVEPGLNVSPRGSEIRAGDRVLGARERLDPAAVGVLAAVGKAKVKVGSRPTVFVLVTGDELVEPAQKPEGAQIRNANGPAVLAQVREAGGSGFSLGVVADDARRIARKVEEGLAGDVLVLSGGVSEGTYDLVEGALKEQGVEILFDKVAIKPGAPLVFGRLRREGALARPGRRSTTLIFGLPGNPVSAQVTFDLFVRAALLRMQGARVVSRPALEVELSGGARNRSGRRAHLPARLHRSGGRLLAEPLPSKGSADLVAHARANALVVLEADRLEARTGERVVAVLLGNFLERELGS
jgi:molybdenum cofactor synthesis domain-containing protein